MARLLGKLIIMMASYGHFFTQMPQPIHRTSEIFDTWSSPPIALAVISKRERRER